MTLAAIFIGGLFAGCFLWAMVNLFNEKWWKD